MRKTVASVLKIFGWIFLCWATIGFLLVTAWGLSENGLVETWKMLNPLKATVYIYLSGIYWPAAVLFGLAAIVTPKADVSEAGDRDASNT